MQSWSVGSYKSHKSHTRAQSSSQSEGRALALFCWKCEFSTESEKILAHTFLQKLFLEFLFTIFKFKGRNERCKLLWCINENWKLDAGVRILCVTYNLSCYWRTGKYGIFKFFDHNKVKVLCHIGNNAKKKWGRVVKVLLSRTILFVLFDINLSFVLDQKWQNFTVHNDHSIIYESIPTLIKIRLKSHLFNAIQYPMEKSASTWGGTHTNKIQ
jgi:hypothetical protein